MRIKISFTKNDNPVPINNQNIINSYIHKCIGRNNKYHDSPSDYSISMLSGGRLNDDKKTLSFNDGGFIIISAIDSDFITTVLNGIVNNNTIGFGMIYEKFEFINEKLYGGWNFFTTLSPILIVKDNYASGKSKFLLLDSDNFELEVKNYLLKKLKTINDKKKIGLNLDDFDVKIPSHPNHKIKIIYINKKNQQGKDVTIKNYATTCRINIKSSKKVAELLYDIGIGQSCGSGFGAIYRNENFMLYRP